ncbi:MAG: TIGR00159 family protein [Lachnospiraceae bacterium]|jgi:diadenylate cyclase|nr:TIGR00159 family protein [Lachnospiraceae bacterium]
MMERSVGMQGIETFVKNYLFWVHLPEITQTDIVEILIIAVLVYNIMVWIKNTRAWVLFKGLIVILVFIFLAAIFQMNTILWLAERTLSVGITALVIIFQPELRKALESLGQKKFFSGLVFVDLQKNNTERYSERTVKELVKACFDMGKVKTGALIVVEREIVLAEFERTGIPLDAMVSNQLIINIFEHNTPLHDGAVIVRGNRIVAATCYLPLSDNLHLSKELGTRHRAAVGVSEVNDSLTIVVSEETGKVSVAEKGRLERDVTPERLTERLMANQKMFEDTGRLEKLKRRLKEHGKETGQNGNK